MIGEDVLYLSVRELGYRIHTRRLSPVELTEAYLERSKKYGPQLNAYATLTPDLALQQARQAEEEIAKGHYRGPLHGIPYAAKDLLAVKGYPTTWGAKPYQNQRFDYNATVINKLNEAGRGAAGESGDDRVGRWTRLPLRGGLGNRRCQESLEHELLDLRLVERFRRDRRLRDGGIRHWHGNLGLDRLPLSLLRRFWIAPHLRTRWPRRRHGALLLHGQDRAHVPHRRRLFPGANGRQRT